MRTIRALGLTIVLAFAAGPVHAGWFEIDVNSDAATAELGAHFGSDPQARFGLGVRGLYNGDEDTTLGAVIARFEAESDGVPGLFFSVGIDGWAGTSDAGTGDDLDIGAAAISVDADYARPSWRGAYLGVGLAFAPDIFTWSDTESLAAWSVRGGYRINPKVRIFVEYNQLRADFVDIGRRTVDEGFKGGFGVRSSR